MSRTFHHGGHNNTWVKRPIWAWMNTPGHWVRDFMNRPKRAATHRIERAVRMGKIDSDAAVWPLGSRKPHRYYW